MNTIWSKNRLYAASDSHDTLITVLALAVGG